MTTQSFKDLIVWNKAFSLTAEIYKVFLTNKDFGFRDQIQRASISIMNNIAEGCARKSDKSFRNYLLIAKGSDGEVESMLMIALELGYVNNEQQRKLLDMTQEVGRLLSGFIKKLSAIDY
jgi:four helix bundle protein